MSSSSGLVEYNHLTSEGDVELGISNGNDDEANLQAPGSMNGANNKSLRFSGGGMKEAVLAWNKLEKFVDSDGAKGDKKQILFGVSGIARPGEMIALMGPSGSGKTTLLNVLGGRGRANLKGTVYINNEPFKKSMRRNVAYVLQEDIFYTELTVRQQLTITSHLRLPDSVSREEKRETVEHVIKTLRIEKCADTSILLISGGEKKRCNIGTELLTNPSILLLDEPTSGLDSTAAHSLIDTMRFMASERMTIISSIHQPSSKVFYAFTKLILLADGHVVYNGPPTKCLAHLATLQLVPPAEYNPADYVMDLVNDTESVEGTKSVRTRMIEGWDATATEQEVETSLGGSHVDAGDGDDSDDGDGMGSTTKYPSSYATQFITLFGRALVVSKQKSMTNLQIYQTIGLALICGFCWFDMDYSEKRVDDRTGFIFFFMTFWFFMTLFQGMMQFLPERTIILKERAAGSYRLSAYYLSKSMSELPVRLFLPFVFLLISFPMASLSPSIVVFIQVVGVQLLAALAGESIGVFVGTTTLDYEKAMVTATLTSMALMLTGGYFVQNLEEFVKWVRYFSPFSYSYNACLRLVFDRDIPCDDGSVFAECAVPGVKSVHPSVVFDYVGQENSVSYNVGLLVVFIVFFRIAAYLTLRFVPHNNGRK